MNRLFTSLMATIVLLLSALTDNKSNCPTFIVDSLIFNVVNLRHQFHATVKSNSLARRADLFRSAPVYAFPWQWTARYEHLQCAVRIRSQRMSGFFNGRR